MLIVKKAKIKIIKPHELKIGDAVLWSNRKCTVKEINRIKKTISSVDSNNMPFNMPFYLTFYKIISSVEINICHVCDNEIEKGEICEFCQKESLNIDEGFGL